MIFFTILEKNKYFYHNVLIIQVPQSEALNFLSPYPLSLLLGSYIVSEQ